MQPLARHPSAPRAPSFGPSSTDSMLGVCTPSPHRASKLDETLLPLLLAVTRAHLVALSPLATSTLWALQLDHHDTTHPARPASLNHVTNDDPLASAFEGTAASAALAVLLCPRAEGGHTHAEPSMGGELAHAGDDDDAEGSVQLSRLRASYLSACIDHLHRRPLQAEGATLLELPNGVVGANVEASVDAAITLLTLLLPRLAASELHAQYGAEPPSLHAQPPAKSAQSTAEAVLAAAIFEALAHLRGTSAASTARAQSRLRFVSFVSRGCGLPLSYGCVESLWAAMAPLLAHSKPHSTSMGAAGAEASASSADFAEFGWAWVAELLPFSLTSSTAQRVLTQLVCSRVS